MELGEIDRLTRVSRGSHDVDISIRRHELAHRFEDRSLVVSEHQPDASHAISYLLRMPRDPAAWPFIAGAPTRGRRIRPSRGRTSATAARSSSEEGRTRSASSRGSHTSSVVLWPGKLQSFDDPPAISARSRIA